ncbi:MAG: MIP/aquaporin family protein [Rhodospirillales bacterium]
MTEVPFQRRLLAEFIGTAGLLATVIGSGIMAERLADGNVAIALLGNTIATGAILVVLITIFGPVSGAHFNPAVTFGFMLRREINRRDALIYVVVQVAGGILGMLVAHAMFEEQIFQLSTKVRTGPAQMFSEGVATFGLMLTILGAVRHRPEAVSWMVGLYITAAYWFTASTSFANPAVTVARALTDTFSGIRPPDAPYFILLQFLGAVFAVFVGARLAYFRKDGEE